MAWDREKFGAWPLTLLRVFGVEYDVVGQFLSCLHSRDSRGMCSVDMVRRIDGNDHWGCSVKASLVRMSSKLF